MMIAEQKPNARTTSKNGRLYRLLSGLFLALIALAPPASAALIPLSFIATATTIDTGITTIAVGDQYLVSLVVDDSVIDTNASVGAGTFANLVTSFNITAMPGNVGTWVPSGTVNLPASNFVTNAFGNNLTFEIIGSGFPDGGVSIPFGRFEHRFVWPPGVTDSGSGDTFSQQLGGPLAVPPAIFTFWIGFTDGEGLPAVLFTATMQTAVPVPIPTLGQYGLAALALGLAWFGWRKWRFQAST